MILKPQFLCYFQAKASQVGLRLLDRSNVLPHLSVCSVNDILNDSVCDSEKDFQGMTLTSLGRALIKFSIAVLYTFII